MQRQALALESRLRSCRNVLTVGVRPNFGDYTEAEARLIHDADKIYYPSAFYAEHFEALGKAIFPSCHSYRCAQDKIKQSTLFQLAGLPHPRTRVFYGKRQQAGIQDYFSFPLIAKEPRGSAMGRGVFLIRSAAELDDYIHHRHVAYIQEYLPIDRDMRIVVVGGRVVHAYWRIAGAGEFRTNVAKGGRIGLDAVPTPALDLACQVAQTCRWDDVGLDICCHDGQCMVLEANMKYGREGFQTAGIDYFALMEQMIENGYI